MVGDAIVAEIAEDGLVTIPGLAQVFMDDTSLDWFTRSTPNLPYDDAEYSDLSRACRSLTTAVARAERLPKTSAIASLERQLNMLPATAPHQDTLAEVVTYARDTVGGTEHDQALRFLLLWWERPDGYDWRLYAIDTRDDTGVHVLEWFSPCKEWRQPKNYSIGKGVAPMDYVRGVFKQILERKITTAPATPSEN